MRFPTTVPRLVTRSITATPTPATLTFVIDVTTVGGFILGPQPERLLRFIRCRWPQSRLYPLHGQRRWQPGVPGRFPRVPLLPSRTYRHPNSDFDYNDTSFVFTNVSVNQPVPDSGTTLALMGMRAWPAFAAGSRSSPRTRFSARPERGGLFPGVLPILRSHQDGIGKKIHPASKANWHQLRAVVPTCTNCQASPAEKGVPRPEPELKSEDLRSGPTYRRPPNLGTFSMRRDARRLGRW